MGMAAILFGGVEINCQYPTTEGPMWKLVKIGPAVSEKMFKKFIISYIFVAQGHGR